MADTTPTRYTGLNKPVLEATERRLRTAFGISPATRTEAFTVPTEATTPAARQSALRKLIESRSAPERLRANPADAVERRLRRIGVPIPAAQVAARERSDRSFAVLEGRGTPAAVGLERIIGRNELLGIQYLDGGRAAARAVGRVVIRSASGAVVGYGTGSLISPRLLMTNNHVLATAAEAGPSVVEFNFQNGRDGRPVPKVTFALAPQTFFLTSPLDELDVTIVAVEPAGDQDLALSDFGFNPLVAVNDEVLNGESVTIIQHPNGEPKQIALRENRVLKLPNTADRFVYYETDTTPGSSGAPVFNDQWEVIALHHSGFPARNAQGQFLTVDGQVWTEDMGEHRIHWIANEGVRVAGLLDFFQNAPNLTVPQRRLLDEILNSPARPPQGEADHAVQLNRVEQPSLNVEAGVAVWTIPLQVSVSIGTASLGMPVGWAPIRITNAGPTPAPTAPPLDSAASLPTDADVTEAKAEFERARTRVYFDKAADEKDRKSYYEDLSDSLDPAALYKALSHLLEETHTTRPAYKPIKHVYPWVDLQPDRKIKSVYSGQMFELLELVRLDVEVAKARRAQLAEIRAAEAFDPGLEAARLDLLEALLPFNCEHVVPQSWFGKKEPMRGDMHHLFACESGCNSFRGNTPYFDFSPVEEAVRQGCGRREETKFEPTAGKGAVARATLYFLLRYPGQIDDDESEYTPDRIRTVIAWHKKFPVGEYERHRNQAIFAVQGNRNPLIDFPDWADKIDFLNGLG